MDNLVNLDGRRIIVVGGANGAGAGAVDAFLAAGAKVSCLDIEVNKGDVSRPGERFRAFQCDVRFKEEVDACVDGAATFMGGLDAMCVTAGITERRVPEAITEDDLDRVMRVNLFGTMFANQAAFRQMRDRGGSIINFVSVSGIRGMPDRAHYCASKGAVSAWTRAIAMDWAPYNIRANAVAPILHTTITDRIIAGLPEADRSAYIKSIGSLQRLPGGLRRADSIGPLLTLLASEGASYMTGQMLSIDGGFMFLGS